jgi:hypothetical protein
VDDDVAATAAGVEKLVTLRDQLAVPRGVNSATVRGPAASVGMRDTKDPVVRLANLLDQIPGIDDVPFRLRRPTGQRLTEIVPRTLAVACRSCRRGTARILSMLKVVPTRLGDRGRPASLPASHRHEMTIRQCPGRASVPHSRQIAKIVAISDVPKD